MGSGYTHEDMGEMSLLTMPRSTICEMQARNRLLEYANRGSMVVGRVGWQI